MTDSISVYSTKDLTGKYPLKTDGKKEKMSLEDRLVAELQQYYGKTISEKSTQALLLRIKNFISGLYPKDGESRFYAILEKAFPGLADEIMQTLQKMEQYNKWLDENESTISGLNDLERQGMLWEKRRVLFGDDADIIWSEEVLAYEKRKQEMKDTLRMLDGSNDTTIDEKLAIFKSTVSQAYEGSPEAYILESTDMLSKVFFGIDSVQEELSKLDPEQRKQEIARIRKGMGFTSDQISELETMDDYRNRRWENGLNYMQERELIANEFTGAELDEQLRILREKYFKHEAKTIELEESDGFFRYERQRIYGRN
ncbi:MAG: hypothetical protein JXM72_01190 [Deltaproteobacteria bacterium]|nr:hypothetical protein [Deltaproteobacteria bacterium]